MILVFKINLKNISLYVCLNKAKLCTRKRLPLNLPMTPMLPSVLYMIPSFTVSQCDPLRGHFEVDHCWHRAWIQGHGTLGCLGNSLWPC